MINRWLILVGLPCLFVWIWCSIPFPVAEITDPYTAWRPLNSTSSTALRSQNYWSSPFIGEFQIPGNVGAARLASGLEFGEASIATSATSSEPDEPGADLSVDANFYFFLFVCEYPLPVKSSLS